MPTPTDASRKRPCFQTKTQQCLHPFTDRTRQVRRRRSPRPLLAGQAFEHARNHPSKSWRLKYRLLGKENCFTIGTYPDISLREASHIARGARRDVANHIAPLKAKTAKVEAQLLNEERTFVYVAEQWLAFKSPDLVSKSVAGFRGALNNYVFPVIGKKQVSEIKLEHITTIITEMRRQRILAMASHVRTQCRYW